MKPQTSTPIEAASEAVSARAVQGKRYFWISAFAVFTMLAASNLPTPLYREYALAFEFSPLTLTLIFAVYVCAMVPSLLIFGPLSDAIGRRTVLTVATVLGIVAMGVFIGATSIGWLLVARLLQGMSVGAASGALTAALAEFEPQRNRHRAALATTVASLGGMGAGPLISGLLVHYGPAHFVLPYVAGLLLLVPMLVLMLGFPDTGTRQAWRPRKPAIPRAMLPTFVHNSVAGFAAFSVLGLFLALVPSIALELTHTDNLLLASGAVTLMLLSSMGVQALSLGRPPLALQRNGLIALSAGVLLLLAAAQYGVLDLLLLAAVCAGAGHGLAFLGGITEVNMKAPPAQHAEVVSTYYVVLYLGLSVPVITVGWLARHYGLLQALQYFAAAIAPLCLLTAIFLQRHAQRR